MQIHSITDRIRKSAAAKSALFAALLLAFAPSALAASAPDGLAPGTTLHGPAASPFLITLVERELARAPAGEAALEAIYRRQVRSLDEAATFFQSAPFLRLSLAGQLQVIDAAVEIDPAAFLPRIEFLPVALRGEYRRKAAAAAEASLLRRLTGLSLQQEARLYLPSRAGMRATEAGGEAFDSEGQVRRFLKDPSLRHLAALDNAWIAAAAGPFVSAEALLEAKVLTARNLDRRGLAPSPENVAAVWTELAAARAELAGLRLFSGREVVFAVGKENAADGPTFGKATTVASLRAQGPAHLELLRSGERDATARLARMIAAAGELTLILETHGRADALEFGGALKADELAAMFAARRQPGRAIVIVNACFGHDFARAFADRLRSRGIAAPILIVPEEFGQATLVGRQESTFTRDELGIGRRDASQLSDLWPGRYRETAVYAPLGQGLAQLR